MRGKFSRAAHGGHLLQDSFSSGLCQGTGGPAWHVYAVHKENLLERNVHCPQRLMKATKKPRPPARKTFRHGDLRRALLQAGIELARGGGPQAIVLREATRWAGVAPNAAYRHFLSHRDLLQAVRAAALSSLAHAIEAEIARARRRKSSPAEIGTSDAARGGRGLSQVRHCRDGSFPNGILNSRSGGA